MVAVVGVIVAVLSSMLWLSEHVAGKILNAEKSLSEVIV
jgi:hypothetical protein